MNTGLMYIIAETAVEDIHLLEPQILLKATMLTEIADGSLDYWIEYNQALSYNTRRSNLFTNRSMEWLDEDGEEGRRENINADPSTWPNPLD